MYYLFSKYVCIKEYIKDDEVLAYVGEVFQPTGYGTLDALDIYTYYNDGRDRRFIRQLSFEDFNEYFERL